MPIRWKNKARLKPQVFLDEIEKVKSVGEDGRVSYTGYEYHNSFASLLSMLDVPAAISAEMDVDTLLSKALGRAAREPKLTAASVREHLNQIVDGEFARREEEYRLLTSLSLRGTPPFRRLRISQQRVWILNGAYPRKYKSRTEMVRNYAYDPALSHEHPGYSRVIVFAKAKSTRGAGTKALNALNLVRAIMCMGSNSGMELVGNPDAPINKIRLGQTHTLHLTSGNAATKDFWYEPSFYASSPYTPIQPRQLARYFQNVFSKLSKCSYRNSLIPSLLRYVRALDERDQDSAAIQLWGALESLASPGEADYAKVVRRCAFLFKEAVYHSQVLEHLREFRNSAVHSGSQSERAKSYCYQMQFYFIRLVHFHLGQGNFCRSLDEANAFLDLPVDTDMLLAQKARVLEALRFRGIES